MSSTVPPLPRRVLRKPGQRLVECHDCGLFQVLPALPSGSTATCGRCDAVLRRRRGFSNMHSLAMALTGLVIFTIAATMPMMGFSLQGDARHTTLASGPLALDALGFWELSVVVAATTILAPMLKLAGTAYVLLGVRLRRPPAHLYVVFRWVEFLRPWAMIEVFMLGVFVAYTKLGDIAHVEVGLAVFALMALMLTMARADSMLDREAVWGMLERKGVTYRQQRIRHLSDSTPGLIGCHCCGLVREGVHDCPRCGSAMHHRKPASLQRAWALLISAALLYIPANLLPVMTVISFGHGAPDTIMSGVIELMEAGMWPLAALVFIASITVPMVKLVIMIILLVSTQRHRTTGLRRLTMLYRIVEIIGRWSMIDVFMISILTALVQLGALASITPGLGVLAFCSVVLLTMISTMCFDPRLMWDVVPQQVIPND